MPPNASNQRSTKLRAALLKMEQARLAAMVVGLELEPDWGSEHWPVFYQAIDEIRLAHELAETALRGMLAYWEGIEKTAQGGG